MSNSTYLGPRYAASQGQDGIPFPSFKDYGGRMTQWQPVAISMSTIKKNMNLPTDNTMFRQGLSSDAIGIGNTSLKNWVSGTQNLGNPSFDTMFCTSNADCSKFGVNSTCNANYEPWPDSHGNQSGSVCSQTIYPEIDSGKYTRSLEAGGIGQSCIDDTSCDSSKGYHCNNTVDFVGKNVQQTGFCAQTYNCGDNVTRYLGYPYNSGIPIVPDKTQNNNGYGYNSMNECKAAANAQQDCKNLNGKFYAVYPGYCPVPSTLRQGGPKGALRTSTALQVQNGFVIPAYATNESSSIGSARASAFNSLTKNTGMREPLQYELSLNPPPPNFQ